MKGTMTKHSTLTVVLLFVLSLAHVFADEGCAVPTPSPTSMCLVYEVTSTPNITEHESTEMEVSEVKTTNSSWQETCVTDTPCCLDDYESTDSSATIDQVPDVRRLAENGRSLKSPDELRARIRKPKKNTGLPDWAVNKLPEDAKQALDAKKKRRLSMAEQAKMPKKPRSEVMKEGRSKRMSKMAENLEKAKLYFQSQSSRMQ